MLSKKTRVSDALASKETGSHVRIQVRVTCENTGESNTKLPEIIPFLQFGVSLYFYALYVKITLKLSLKHIYHPLIYCRYFDFYVLILCY